jgi:hypothetical protein
LRSLQEIQPDFEEAAKAYAGLWSHGKKKKKKKKKKLTRLHDSIDEYLKLSITYSLTDSDRLSDSDRLYESLLNCDGGTENTQLKFIEKENDIHFLELIESYTEPISHVKDHFLQKYVIRRALQIMGECTADNKQQRCENRETERVILDETRSILIERLS